MNSERYNQVKQVYKAAIECKTGERAAFLAGACANDAELRTEVESLLKHDESAGEFIEQSAFDVAARMLANSEAASIKGTCIGPYRILNEIGRGGMGVVYLAVREDEEFRQRVALKLIKRGLDTEEILRRFRNERQILASLNHPNIAKLFDGGTTAEGAPYFVMEYVEGLPLLQYCNEHDLSTDERLQLFRTICSAVQHAHQNLVIHRDLKPSNIIVTHEGEPKLLDFGVAKFLNPELMGHDFAQTQTRFRALTPEYASPEQMRGQHITTASDLYSLGVILYELLTGLRPYQLKDTTPEELARVICNSEPTKPSEAATGVRNAESQFGNGPASGGSISAADLRSRIKNLRSLKGDLDNIVLMALRKEPSRRYKSVEQFSEDIERHLKGLPVIARKDTFAYRASKLISRNRVAVSATALVVLAIIAGLIVALWQGENARRQRDLARQERIKSERINQFLQRMLSFSNQSVTSVWPVPQKKNATVNEMLDRITPQVEIELADLPEERAQVLRTIGNAYASQGQYESAERNLRAALDTQTRLYGEDNPEVATTMSELGILSYRQTKYDEANRLLEKAVAVYRKQRQTNAPSYSAVQLALALHYLGIVKMYQVDPYAGKPLLNEALQIAYSANPQAEPGVLAFIKSDVGAVLISTGELEKGESLLREALFQYRQISSSPLWEEGSTLTLLGAAANIRHQPDEAEKYLLEGEKIFRAALGDRNIYVSYNLYRQAVALSQKNDFKAAEAKARESLAVVRDFSPDSRLVWAPPIWTLGDVLIKAGRAREGEDYLRQALAIYKQQDTKNYFNIATLKIDLSQFLLSQNRLAEAEQMAVEARDEVRQNLGETHPLLKTAANNLNKIFEKEGKPAVAQRPE
jgi:serine/threonine protein kinase